MRFIYVYVYVYEEDWYLSFDIEQRRDVIDCSGWDLRKALYLFTRTHGLPLQNGADSGAGCP
ncbi:MAG: hypothetical protein D3924_00335 [Candidatus Electrothrix sp. AR4]|nr:hypothetical protein [Candidatus Electrothrix sp. AR4]